VPEIDGTSSQSATRNVTAEMPIGPGILASNEGTLEVRRLRLEPQPMATRVYAESVASTSAFDSSSYSMMDFDDLLENFPRATAFNSSTNASMVETQDTMCQTGQPRLTQRSLECRPRLESRYICRRVGA